MLEPYFESDDGRVVLYCGDCRDIMPQLDPVDAIITDPVWPNALPELIGADDPKELLRTAAVFWPDRCKRAVVQLGCNSDPRILEAIPNDMPFLRTCWLEYVRPHYLGRLLYTGDVAYVYGEWPPSEPGAHVIPGRTIQNDGAKVKNGHPCPRQLQHVSWLVRWFARGTVLDPFSGSATTGVAAIKQGYPYIGIEISEQYCEIAKRRLLEALAQPQLPLEVGA